MENKDKIINFPSPTPSSNSDEITDHTIRIDSFQPASDKVVSIEGESSFGSEWRDHAKKLIEEANLPELPANIFGIKNGTILRSNRFMEVEGINNKEDVVVYYDGSFINIGGVSSPYKISLEDLIKEINDGHWEVVGEI